MRSELGSRPETARHSILKTGCTEQVLAREWQIMMGRELGYLKKPRARRGSSKARSQSGRFIQVCSNCIRMIDARKAI